MDLGLLHLFGFIAETGFLLYCGIVLGTLRRFHSLDGYAALAWAVDVL